MKRIAMVSAIIAMLVVSGCMRTADLPPLPVIPTPALIPALSVTPITDENLLAARELQQFQGADHAPVVAVAFSEDGQELAAVSVGAHGRLSRWRVADGALLASTDLGDIRPFVAALDPSARRLAMTRDASGRLDSGASFVGVVELWDARTGQIVQPEVWHDLGFSTRTTYLAFSKDAGNLAYAAGYLRGAQSLSTGAGLNTANTDTRTLMTDRIIRRASKTDVVTFDVTGEWVAHADRDGTVMLEESGITGLPPQSKYPFGLTVRKNRSFPARVLALTLDPQRRWLAVLDHDALEVYEVARGKRVLRAEGSEGDLGALTFSPDGRLLAVGKEEGLEIWSVGDWSGVGSWSGQPVFSIAFSPDGRLMATGDADGAVSVRGVR